MDQLIAIWSDLDWSKQVGTAIFAFGLGYALIWLLLAVASENDTPAPSSEKAALPPAEPDYAAEGLTIVIPGRVLAQRGAESIGKAVERAIGGARGVDRGPMEQTRNPGSDES